MIRLKHLLTEANSIKQDGSTLQFWPKKYIFNPAAESRVTNVTPNISLTAKFTDQFGQGTIIDASINLNTDCGLEAKFLDTFPLKTPGQKHKSELDSFEKKQSGLVLAHRTDKKLGWWLSFNLNIKDGEQAQAAKTIRSDKQFGTLTLTFKDRPPVNTSFSLGPNGQTLVYNIIGNPSAILRYEGEPDDGLGVNADSRVFRTK